MSAHSERGPIAAAESERADILKIAGLLRARRDQGPKLVGPEGEEVELPESIVDILRQVVQAMVRDQAVTVVPIDVQLTTQKAADLLGMSRSYLRRLLDEGQIPFSKTGTHRRVRFEDLMEYRRQRDARRREGLARVTRLSQEHGLDSDV